MNDVEHFESYCLFALLSVEAIREFGVDSDEYRQCERHRVTHASLIGGNVSLLRKNLGIKTALDIAAPGRKVRT